MVSTVLRRFRWPPPQKHRQGKALDVLSTHALLLLLLATAALPTASAQTNTRIGPVSVTVSGIDGELRENVLAFLTIAAAERGLLARLSPRGGAPDLDLAELERRHRAAPDEIREALMPFGYYLPQVDAELVATRTGYEARYTVDPGPPARLGDVEIRVEGEGADEPAIRQAAAAAGLRPGERLVHGQYEAARERLFDAAYNGGYLRARWLAREIRVHPDRRTADIRLVLDTGPRFYFGDVVIEAERLRPDFIARFVDIEPGEPYALRRLLALQLTLNDTGYFSAVEIRADPADADAESRIPVRVLTQPALPQRYTVGVGYATDTGPRFNFGALLRRTNARGHRFSSELRLSAIESAVAGRYAIPTRNVATDLIDLSLSARQVQSGDAESRQYATGISQYVGWRGFRRRAYVQLEREEFQFGDLPTQTAKLFYPGLTLTRETSDDLLYPRRGYSVALDLRTATDGVLSDVSFTRLRADFRWARGVGERARVLLRAEAGALDTDSFASLPPTQRFFAGGDRSVRGYGYQTIGERNQNDDVIGGRYLLVTSIEAERLFFGDFGGAVFIDAGDAFNGSFKGKVGAGIGFRWRSPVGMVRIDLAHPFHTDDDDVRLHLSIGADL